MSQNNEQSLSQEFLAILEMCNDGPVRVQAILDRIHGRGEAIITLFLGAPFLLPVPMPGLSIPFGLLIIAFGLAITTGWLVPLPKSLLGRQIPDTLIRRLCDFTLRFLQKLESYIKPRMFWISKHRFSKASTGLMITLCGCLLALPLPPGTNAPPALAIVCLSIALLEKDGLLLLFGLSIFIFNIFFFGLIAFLGYEAILALVGLGI